MNSWENGIIKSNPIVRINLLTVPYSKRLNIEQIYPSNANEFSITYEFVPPGLLKVENNYITALNDVPIGNTSVDVIVKATGHAEIVHITILNPDEKDEISQGGLLFEQSQ